MNVSQSLTIASKFTSNTCGFASQNILELKLIHQILHIKKGKLTECCGEKQPYHLADHQNTSKYRSLSVLTDFQSHSLAHVRHCRIAANIGSPVIEKRTSLQSRRPKQLNDRTCRCVKPLACKAEQDYDFFEHILLKL